MTTHLKYCVQSLNNGYPYEWLQHLYFKCDHLKPKIKLNAFTKLIASYLLFINDLNLQSF